MGEMSFRKVYNLIGLRNVLIVHMDNITHKSEIESEPESRLGAIFFNIEGGKTFQRYTT